MPRRKTDLLMGGPARHAPREPITRSRRRAIRPGPDRIDEVTHAPEGRSCWPPASGPGHSTHREGV